MDGTQHGKHLPPSASIRNPSSAKLSSKVPNWMQKLLLPSNLSQRSPTHSHCQKLFWIFARAFYLMSPPLYALLHNATCTYTCLLRAIDSNLPLSCQAETETSLHAAIITISIQIMRMDPIEQIVYIVSEPNGHFILQCVSNILPNICLPICSGFWHVFYSIDRITYCILDALILANNCVILLLFFPM